jgi:hypothetical protein
MHLSAHPAFHQADLLSLISTSLHPRGVQDAYKFHLDSFSRYFFILRTIRIWWDGAVMHHAVARSTQPCQVWNFVDSVKWKHVVDVMTVLYNCL